MNKKVGKDKYFKFLMYLVAVVLINVAGVTLFARMDLTSNKVYSLSSESRKMVATLSEPLTIKVFFTRDLPAPYNTIERYLHDLLEEYAAAGNRYFNYQFYNVSSDADNERGENRELAQGYGIYPVQIRSIEQDEVKFRKAYMGMVLIHGDIVETISAITSTDGLEYQITSAIRKMNNKISALLRLKENVQVRLYLSSSLQVVGPYMNLAGLPEIPRKIEAIVTELNGKSYGKLSFVHADPSLQKDLEAEAKRYQILALQWNDFIDRQGRTIHADKGYAGIVVEHGGKSESIEIIDVFRLPLFGTQYQLADMKRLEKAIEKTVENVINVNEEIGYLASHGTLTLSGGFQMPGEPLRQESLSHFNRLLSGDYTITPVDLKETGIPEGLSTLVIAGPREEFSEYELYQIDQFLMKGKNLAIFMDPFNETMAGGQNRMMMGQGQTFYLPIHTGLEKLLGHYGLNARTSYILDMNSFKQRIPEPFGGGERPIYFAPIIKNEMINKDVRFMKDIKGLIMLKASPIQVDEQKVKDSGLQARKLFSSSEKSWEMTGRIDLNPMFIQPPAKDDEYRSMAMAYLLEGSFPSYYADKPIPEREEAKEGETDGRKGTGRKTERTAASDIISENATIRKGKQGRIFLIGTSEILKDNVFDEEGKSPNAQFVLNVIDYLNGRGENAMMRTKAQSFNPLADISPSTRTFIKGANIAGPPILVIIAGLIVWVRRLARKRLIQQIFRK